MSLSHTRFIFPKSEIQDPMNAVFNAPMTSHRIRKGFYRGEAEQKVAGFLRDLLRDASFRSDHANPSQAFPSLLRIQILQNRWITDGPVLSDFQTSMGFFDHASGLRRDGGKGLFLGHAKSRFHLIVEISLIVLESQGVIAFLLNNLFGNFG